MTHYCHAIDLTGPGCLTGNRHTFRGVGSRRRWGISVPHCRLEAFVFVMLVRTFSGLSPTAVSEVLGVELAGRETNGGKYGVSTASGVGVSLRFSRISH